MYSGKHFYQSAFGIDYTASLDKLKSLFVEFGGDMEYIYKDGSLVWLARRFSWSVFPDNYSIEEFNFSPCLFFSEDMVGWIALLLGIIKLVNRENDRIVNLRDIYAQIVLMSLFQSSLDPSSPDLDKSGNQKSALHRPLTWFSWASRSK
jgi:hypothetical protein